MLKSFVFAFLVSAVTHVAIAQSGCMDPLATNFNTTATHPDSTCLYPTTSTGTAVVCGLPAVLKETSGILNVNGRWFSHNDAGNAAELYEIDPSTCSLLKTFKITNAGHLDWEDIAADSQYVYIGDFGNNNGNRTDLRILRLKKAHLLHPDSLQGRVDIIRFKYPDQTSFQSSNTNNFDCEAFFYFRGRLHLFSKNRGNKRTKWYSLAPIPSLTDQVAQLHDSLNVRGLITGAAISPDGKKVTLLGYDNTLNTPVFVWLLFGFPESKFFSGNRRRIELPTMSTSGQAEGIDFIDNQTLMLSNEELGNVTPKLRQFSINAWVQPFLSTPSEQLKKSNKGFLYPNPGRGQFFWQGPEVDRVYVFTTQGKRVEKLSFNRLDFSDLNAGSYWIKLFSASSLVYSGLLMITP